ncbi:dihydroorotate oxidase B, electron transfer subunit [Klenkia soli]|uniref:Dihydroorotate oxidase B, electron transfer subunit n=1 Tax=Klenkia soli TaxID=1052260 RepID=A0A1H0LT84_9ACTN|nr:dihydroorotate dehydrogenase electron transfer subunit [Klenkia soli]SDO71241.1 dihydroorotate oxidase B, electron transfer subunit [Klenkia soli]
MTEDGATRMVQLPSGDRVLPPVPGSRTEPLGQPAPPAEHPPVQGLAVVVGSRPVSAYTELTLEAPDIAQVAQPGQFVAFAVGGPTSAMLLRRSIAIAGVGDGRFSVVVSARAAGSTWLAGLRPGDEVDVVGPLGRPFPLPPEGTPTLLVGGGYGAAALVGLGGLLRSRGHEVAAVVGAGDAARLCSVDDLAAVAAPFVVTTDDGSAGRPGRVTGPVADLVSGAGAVYACGPMPMLAAVAKLATDRGVPSWVAVEESMACGVGVCMTCVLPVVGADGRSRFARSCVEGPVFAGDRVRFADVGTLPPDLVGADAMTLSHTPAVEGETP